MSLWAVLLTGLFAGGASCAAVRAACSPARWPCGLLIDDAVEDLEGVERCETDSRRGRTVVVADGGDGRRRRGHHRHRRLPGRSGQELRRWRSSPWRCWPSSPAPRVLAHQPEIAVVSGAI